MCVQLLQRLIEKGNVLSRGDRSAGDRSPPSGEEGKSPGEKGGAASTNVGGEDHMSSDSDEDEEEEEEEDVEEERGGEGKGEGGEGGERDSEQEVGGAKSGEKSAPQLTEYILNVVRHACLSEYSC